MKHRYIAKRYWIDKSTAMGQSDVMAKSFDNVINLSLGDPDIVTSELIINKAFDDAKAGHTKYTDFRGDPELRNEIRKYYKDEYSVDIGDEEVFVTASATLAMYLALEAIIDDGDEVILQTPHFTPYPQQVELARGIPVNLDTFEDEDFQVNIERLESLITDRTKALVINSPNNPTGNCLTFETMNKIAAVVEKHDLVVISDEIYKAYSYQHSFVPFMTIPGMKERTITLNSFSKDFVMTGWRVGNLIAPSYIVKVVQQINENVVFTAPSVSQRAAIYALRYRKEVQPPLIDTFKERMFYAAERINRINNMHVIAPPKGSFYLLINIKDTGMTSKDAADLILQKAHVLTLPGTAFGSCGEGYLRIACTVSVKDLAEAFDRIEKIDIFKTNENK